MRRILTFLIPALLAGILLFIASRTTPPTATKPTTMRIGVAAGLTGFAAEWGEDELRAAELAVADFNAHNQMRHVEVELKIEDTKSDNSATASSFHKLINIDTVHAILGPTWGETFASGLKIANDAKIPVVSASAALEVANSEQDLPYIFSTFWPQAPEIAALQTYLRDNAKQRVVVLNDTGAYNAKISELFIKQAKQSHIEILDHITFPPTTTDFRTFLLKAASKNPAAIFVEIEDISQLGPLLKQAKELGITTSFFSTASAQSELLVKDFAPYAEGLIYSFPAIGNDDAHTKLVERYAAEYGRSPSGPSFVNAYNAARAILTTIQHGARTSEEIYLGLKSGTFPGTGIPDFSFSPLGQLSTASFEIRTLKNGQFVPVETQ